MQNLEEVLGQIVRKTWVDWANKQPNPKTSWTQPWEEIPEEIKEVDRLIGIAIAQFLINELGFAATQSPGQIANKVQRWLLKESINRIQSRKNLP